MARHRHGVSACDGGSIVTYPSVSVHVDVTWPNMGDVKPVTTDSILTPPKNVLNATSAYNAIKVLDRDGLPTEGRPCTCRFVRHSQDTTGPDGCATFVLGAAGTYTMSLTEGSSGYVTYNGVTSATATLTAGRLTVRSFSYDLGVRLHPTLKPPTGFALPTTRARDHRELGHPAGGASYPSTARSTTVEPSGRSRPATRPGPAPAPDPTPP